MAAATFEGSLRQANIGITCDTNTQVLRATDEQAACTLAQVTSATTPA